VKLVEWFCCGGDAGCRAYTKVEWDGEQTSREIDCVACRRQVTLLVDLVIDGQPVLDDDGQPAKTGQISNVGCRYTVTKGGGVEMPPVE